jgi:type IV secretion system protein TrbL
MRLLLAPGWIHIPNPIHIITKVIGGAAGDAITALAQSIIEAVAHMIGTLATFWTSIPSPTLTDGSGNPIGANGVIEQNLAWYVGVVMLFGILIGAARIMWSERQGHEARELVGYLIKYIIWAFMGTAAAGLLVIAMDGLTSQLVSHALGNQSFADKLTQLLGLGTGGADGTSLIQLAGSTGTAFLAIPIGLIALLSSLLEVILMFVRAAMLVLLCGVLPLAAAASNTEVGAQWLKKLTAWILAFALYKPAAAIIFLGAFALPLQGGITGLLEGATMLVLSIFALPALMRFLVPATAAVAGGPGAGALFAGAAGAAVTMFAANSDSGSGPSGASSQAYNNGSSGGGGGFGGGSGPTGSGDDHGGGAGGGGVPKPPAAKPPAGGGAAASVAGDAAVVAAA